MKYCGPLGGANEKSDRVFDDDDKDRNAKIVVARTIVVMMGCWDRLRGIVDSA